MPTRVKICGITRPEDAALAAELGADAIGLNFVAGPRMISADQAKAILRSISIPDMSEPMPHLERSPIPVALCHAPSKQQYNAFWPTQAQGLRINRFQIYGEDTMQLSQKLNGQIWRVVPIASIEDVRQLAANLQSGLPLAAAGAIVVDTASGQKLGGTGKAFDWSWIQELYDDTNSDKFPPLILAGGLIPDNVATAIRIAQPYAVDVSSGVEVPGKPGIKDPIKLRDFIQAAKAAL